MQKTYIPPAYSEPPDGYIDVDVKIPFEVVLQSLEAKPNLARDVPTDGDFIWRATLLPDFTDLFSIRYADSQGYYFSSARINVLNQSSAASHPSVNAKEIVIPAGGQIGIDIENLAALVNTIQIVFLGVKRYKIGGDQ